jgi:cell wall-associated NlpC family hydrolase
VRAHPMAGCGCTPLPARGGGLVLLVLVTVLVALVAPHAKQVRGQLADVAGAAPALRLPHLQGPGQGSSADRAQARVAVRFALAQRGKPYRWGATGPASFDCSGLTMAAWRQAGVSIPRTAAGQLVGLPRARGRLQPGDLVIYRTSGPSRRHVAMVTGPGRVVEARSRSTGVISSRLRIGWLGVVRPGAG